MSPRSPTLAVGQEADLCLIFEIRWLRSGKLAFGLADALAVESDVVVRPRRVPGSSLYKAGFADDFARSANCRQRFSFLGRLGTVRLVCVTRARPVTPANHREWCWHNVFRRRRP
jgi:hypothetical protein